MSTHPDFLLDDEEADSLPLEDLSNIETISDLDIDKALITHYKEAIALLSTSAPLNQKAQAMGVIINILTQISRLQIDLYSADKFKQYEDALIETLKEFPEIKTAFLEKYELKARGVNSMQEPT